MSECQINTHSIYPCIWRHKEKVFDASRDGGGGWKKWWGMAGFCYTCRAIYHMLTWIHQIMVDTLRYCVRYKCTYVLEMSSHDCTTVRQSTLLIYVCQLGTGMEGTAEGRFWLPQQSWLRGHWQSWYAVLLTPGQSTLDIQHQNLTKANCLEVKKNLSSNFLR